MGRTFLWTAATWQCPAIRKIVTKVSPRWTLSWPASQRCEVPSERAAPKDAAAQNFNPTMMFDSLLAAS
jgi:hypothetical protein